MGIPYSRQINQAFDQVTPLVAAGFRVLQTTRNISILLAVIQVLTVLLLGLILIVLLALLVSVNPHLEEQRDELVTPALQKVCEGSVRLGRGLAWLLWISVVGSMVGGGLGIYWTAKHGDLGEEAEVDAEVREEEAVKEAEDKKGEEVEVGG
ncbi:uncharacterized protein HMPREF1541_09441 [Cyphellophora europaea CBS 101466]|uniref:Uncharacterized protein n=1 Tax=Cyphellophora europaea (strain CBS 101466) TaxID=1220924 RepID=W2SCF0_CYPE1|nr:uncharacterized protein HMPREF1541_09441 [Cyphellophora europaea CBS 101466]ETN45609.1 hypothetical protein HMPREF1541_09441 [Cyphellophora europaea CBS 101466]